MEDPKAIMTANDLLGQWLELGVPDSLVAGASEGGFGPRHLTDGVPVALVAPREKFLQSTTPQTY